MTGRVCKCGKGYVSAWDGKCGHCRTRRERQALYHLQNPKPDREALAMGFTIEDEGTL